MKSRPFLSVPNGHAKQPGETVYCICRRPDSGKWMIGCDGCDDWFHGECVNLRQQDEDLVDQYFCPSCQGTGSGSTTWKRKCRLRTCQSPAAVNDTPPSKFCSPKHGVEFFQLKCAASEYSLSELSALANAVQDAASFRRLGDCVPAPQRPDSRSKLDSMILRDFEQLMPQKDALSHQQRRFGARSTFIGMVKDRHKRVGEELRNEGDQGSKGAKDICGFDVRLALDDEEFAEWCESEEGQAIFAQGQIKGRDGICLKKKCEKHKYWLRIAMEDAELEERLINENSTTLSTEENGLRQRQHIKSLMENQRIK